MSEQEFLAQKPYLKCCKECGDDECTEACEQAEWAIAKRKFNQKCKALNYPGQERFGKSNKLFIHLGEEQNIYVTAPARETLDWLEINEPQFIASLVAMIKGPLYSFQKMRDDWVMSGRRVIVSKATDGDIDEGQPYIRIDIKEFSGMKNNGKDWDSPWRGPYPTVTVEQILAVNNSKETTGANQP